MLFAPAVRPARAGALGSTLLMTLLLAGCGAHAHQRDSAPVRAAMRGFLGSVAQGDLHAACDALNPGFAASVGCGTPRAATVLDLARALGPGSRLTAARRALLAAGLRQIDIRTLHPGVLGASVNVVWQRDPRALTTTYHLSDSGGRWRIDDIALGPPAAS